MQMPIWFGEKHAPYRHPCPSIIVHLGKKKRHPLTLLIWIMLPFPNYWTECSKEILKENLLRYNISSFSCQFCKGICDWNQGTHSVICNFCFISDFSLNATQWLDTDVCKNVQITEFLPSDINYMQNCTDNFWCEGAFLGVLEVPFTLHMIRHNATP